MTVAEIVVEFDEVPSEVNDIVVNWMVGLLWRRGYLFLSYEYSGKWVAEVFKRDMFEVFADLVDDVYSFRKFVNGFNMWICNGDNGECIEYDDGDYERLTWDEYLEVEKRIQQVEWI